MLTGAYDDFPGFRLATGMQVYTRTDRRRGAPIDKPGPTRAQPTNTALVV
jgi:hypothetical protein